MQDGISNAIEQAWEDEHRRAISYAITEAAESLTADDPKAFLDRTEYHLGNFRLDEYGRSITDDVVRAAREAAGIRGYHAGRAAVSEANPQPELVRA